MSLDLKELERKLDNALAKETPESLTNWLNKQRMKLTIEKLAPYLPYDLNCSIEHGWVTMETLNDYCINVDQEDSYSYEDHPGEILEFKPMLVPLAELTEEHWKLLFVGNKHTFKEFDIEGFVRDIDILNFSYPEWQIIFKNHYDVFGLIEAELAVKK